MIAITHLQNLVEYVDQLDRHHEYLTVKETLDFAFKCRRGGTHRHLNIPYNPENDAKIAELDKADYTVNLVMEALGLKRVEDTFVGDDERVRGVSGGERKRVTVGEMACTGTPIICMDEISTGLDGMYTFP